MLIGIAVIGIAVYVGAPAHMDYRICFTWHRRQSPRQLYQFNHRLTYRPSLRGGLYLTQKNFYDIIYIESEG